MKLKELQEQFANQIYNPKNDKIFSEIKSQNISVADLLSVYRNNIFGNFDSVLKTIYPSIKKLVGDDCFDNLCKKYHQQYPSKSGNLDEYGKYFYKLVMDLENEHKLAYLKDLSKLEWKYHFAYFALDVADFEIEKFQNLKEKDLFKVKFKLHPSCCLMASKYPIDSIWKFSKTNGRKKLNLKNLKKESILIERAKWRTNITNLLDTEFLFLKQIKQGQNLYQIYQNLSKENPNFDIGFLINKYISGGVIASYEL